MTEAKRVTTRRMALFVAFIAEFVLLFCLAFYAESLHQYKGSHSAFVFLLPLSYPAVFAFSPLFKGEKNSWISLMFGLMFLLGLWVFFNADTRATSTLGHVVDMIGLSIVLALGVTMFLMTRATPSTKVQDPASENAKSGSSSDRIYFRGQDE